MRLMRLTAVSLILLLTACNQSSDVTGTSAERIYRHSMDGIPNDLDPVRAGNVYASFLVVNVFDTLYRYQYLARPYAITPNLASSMPRVSDDGLKLTISIKRGVYFADDPAFAGGKGRELVAEDVIYSLKRHFDPDVGSQGTWLWRGRIAGMEQWQDNGTDYDQPVSGLRAIDSHTIEVTLTQPYPQFIYSLTTAYSAIVPREAVETYGPEFSVRPTGSGPFQLTRLDSTQAELTRNPRYRQEPIDLAAEGYDTIRHADRGLENIGGRIPPLVDKAIVDFAVDGASGWVSFTAGNEIQHIRIPTDLYDQTLESRTPPVLKPELLQRYQMHVNPEFGVTQITFNMDDPGIGYSEDQHRNARNRDLRCALIKAFDWDQRNKVFYAGIAEVFPGIIPPAVPEFDPDLERQSVTRDTEAARRVFSQYPDFEELPILQYAYASGVVQQRGYEQFRAQMAAAGYPAEKITRRVFASFGDLIQAARQGAIQIMLYAWTLDYPDAENVLQLFYGPNRSPGSNMANYANPEFDRLYEQASVMMPSPERTRIYRRMNQMLIDDCVTIAGVSRVRVYLTHKDVIGIPDRELVGGYFLKFVDLAGPG